MNRVEEGNTEHDAVKKFFLSGHESDREGYGCCGYTQEFVFYFNRTSAIRNLSDIFTGGGEKVRWQ